MFSTAVVVGYGVAGDVKRLLTSYPRRLAPVAVAAAESAVSVDGDVSAAGVCAEGVSASSGVHAVCVRDVALSLGIDAAAAASLASLCRALLDGRGEGRTGTQCSHRYHRNTIAFTLLYLYKHVCV